MCLRNRCIKLCPRINTLSGNAVGETTEGPEAHNGDWENKRGDKIRYKEALWTVTGQSHLSSNHIVNIDNASLNDCLFTLALDPEQNG